MEKWREIKGFNGYEVSDCGRVRTRNKITYTDRHGARHWKDRVLKIKTCKQNECRVCLWKDGKDYYFLVHRLVAIAFLKVMHSFISEWRKKTFYVFGRSQQGDRPKSWFCKLVHKK